MTAEPRPSEALERLRAVLAETDLAGNLIELEQALAVVRRAGYVAHYGACSPTVPVVPAARLSDPSTSHAAAARALPRSRSVAFAMLRAFARVRGGAPPFDALNADEAGALAERYHPRASRGAWRRMSELERFGLIEPAVDESGRPLERVGLSGAGQRLYRITLAGLAYLARVMPDYGTPAADPEAFRLEPGTVSP